MRRATITLIQDESGVVVIDVNHDDPEQQALIDAYRAGDDVSRLDLIAATALTGAARISNALSEIGFGITEVTHAAH